MLRGSERETALSKLKKATDRYEAQAKGTQEEITNLFLLRQKCSEQLITHVENYGRCEQVPDMRSSYSSGAHPRGTS
ncbi:hypothetical protein [Enterobacter hormaechei]|uniref:hypothetical protein n=1 Tax=Enterobacter hormaechei TaxID=158836 RepID=UPI003A96C24F